MELREISAQDENLILGGARQFAELDPLCLNLFFPDFGPDSGAFWFKGFIKSCEDSRLDWRPGPGKVSCTRYILLNDDATLVGLGIMRFPLTSDIEAEGGNLVFCVLPEQRRQGWGTLTLNRMLFEAVRAGMARVLVSCDETNLAAEKCILKNRGEMQGVKGGRKYFWIHFR